MKNIRLLLNRINLLIRFLLQSDFRVAFRYFLWLVKFQDILPGFVINSVPLKENNSPMVDIHGGDRLIVAAEIPKVREEVKMIIIKALEFIPNDYMLCVISAYRNIEEQKRHWEETLNLIKKEFPLLLLEEQRRKARLFTAEPVNFGPHQTGGAIDVILLTKNKIPVSMGTKYRESSQKTKMFSKFCSDEEKVNRAILRNAMLKAGFWFYPGEWWHYCYGDKMWGAYTGSTAFYGPVKINNNFLK